MKAKELIKKLKEINQEAEVGLCIRNKDVITVADGSSLKVENEGLTIWISGKIK